MGGVTQGAVEAAAELFQAAGLGQASWSDALDGLAAVTGSTGAQLIGLGSEATVPFNVMTGVPAETGEAFLAAGGGDPAVNSRVRVGMRAGELAVLDETAFTTAADMRLNPQYGEWIRTWDMHHTCLTNLVVEPDRHAGLALLRSQRQGNVDDEQKRAFAALAAHARSAVRTQIALEAQGAQLLAGAMEAVRATAFFCDTAGRVRGMTASAEALLAAGDLLRLNKGVLTTACDADRRGRHRRHQTPGRRRAGLRGGCTAAPQRRPGVHRGDAAAGLEYAGLRAPDACHCARGGGGRGAGRGGGGISIWAQRQRGAGRGSAGCRPFTRRHRPRTSGVSGDGAHSGPAHLRQDRREQPARARSAPATVLRRLHNCRCRYATTVLNLPLRDYEEALPNE